MDAPNPKTISHTRVAMSLQFDPGSILFTDTSDGCVFYIEDTYDTVTSETDKMADLSRHFVRQHLIKNGMASTAATRLLRGKSTVPEMVAVMTSVHLELCDGSVEEGLRATYKVLGTLVSTLEQREKAVVYLREKIVENQGKENASVRIE